MKKFYYFSKSKLKFVEIRNFYQKFVFLVLFFSVLVSFFVFGSFLVFDEVINPDSEVKQLKKKNSMLQEKFDGLLDQYKGLDQRITQLSDQSHDLRLMANLDPINTDSLYGIGGSVFEPVRTSSLSSLDKYLENLNSYVNQITLKVKLERNSYSEIETTLKENEKIFEVIPAIQPCTGYVADDFGMRFHPILRLMRMHEGIDIITDTGTKVYAPGSGTVEYVGWRSGYGNTVEINHGFGYKTLYGHLKAPSVRQGQIVKRGDLIAYSGNTGELTSGSHLHYEVKHNGIPLDPRNFMLGNVNIFEVVKK
jgi:murein DD-endopeptidase MepM/ murein hydrolase activator NlpD